ncbi:hypothetical protein BDF19DRAFT_414580 [Syncephalis fuscata]|nr:hypothetical protein BDF19DRAFT_414580 [Syncephalis fuscata]
MFSNFISGLDRPWFIHRKGYFAAKNSASKKQQYWHSLLILLMASSIGCFVSATAVETAVPVASKFPFESALLLRKILTTDSDKGPLVSLAKIACLVNEERGMHDLPNVSISRILNRSAQKHTVDQAQMHEMTHTGSDGSRPSQRVRRVGYNYRAVGECVAFGYETEEEVMRAWMNSPPHKAIILDRTYRELGIGYARSADSVPYWTMDFGMNDKSPTSNVTACPTEADMAMDEPEQINNLIPTATVTTTELSQIQMLRW